MGKENVRKSANVKSDGKKKVKEKKEVTKEDSTESVVEVVDVGELMRGVKMSEKLARALEDVREPVDRSRIQDDIKELGWQFKSSCEGYKFETRGPLFSEVLEHASVAECHLVKDSKGPLPAEDCQLLYDGARSEFEHVTGICVAWATSDGKSHEGWGQQHLKRADITSVVISGLRKVPGGWILPTSLNLSINSKHAHDVKVSDLVDLLDKGDYAGLVLQLQVLFKQKKRVRDPLVALDNEHLGRLRFLVTQLEMLDAWGGKNKDKALDYIRSHIGGLNLEWYQKDPSTKNANDALQARAAIVLKHLYDAFLPLIKPSSQRDLFATAFKKALGPL
mmetsp:Transcript_10752/g.34398  ORF Transcript_10752/g.34398 Transcript_10752/m.34398 type:complete len:335 (-) Transcript_10752:309-1313(-)|eukprot:CAMPEP_0197396770 /NCGR_PEP_ID=MMETSP1165-20131217/10292_1 /TAXON_ID=284809 /ORGANISM="Chrysocystis fragilis, Strain CCMP3189" /LENGTH=334 /DNA_ID=CAMNT_0042922631 /DNA_START=1 /DNA_END=1005 /DNA_ORIENTATION=+